MKNLRPRTLLPLLTLGLALLVAGAPALAQRQGYTYLSYVGSDVALVSSGEDDTSARQNTPVVAGDRLVTGTTSRSEAVFADGAILRVDARTTLRFDSLARTYESEDDRNLVYLEKGAVSLETRTSSASSQASRIDTADVTVVLRDAALVRVDAGARGTEVYVAEGSAEVLSRSGREVLSEGEYAFSNGNDDLDTGDGDLPRDRFTRFIEERRERVRDRGATRYVDAEYEYDYDLASFDDHGSWVYVSSYGSYCWRPTVVTDWRPYWNGYWRWTPAGMTWVSYEPWGWLPYHYGTWLWEGSFGWCWRPGSYYSPAWVYWNYTPSWVGWCPIGYYGYNDHWYRSNRSRYGWETGIRYPHLAGRVDVARIDPRGWNYTSIGRIGTRFDTRDLVRGDRLGVRTGHVGVIATAPLRIGRGSGPVRVAVQDAVRRVATGAGSEGRGASRVDEGLTGILRRDASLDSRSRTILENSTVRAGADPSYRPTDARTIGSGRRVEVGTGPSRNAGPVTLGGNRSGTRDANEAGPVRRGASPDVSSGSSETRPVEARPARESWRDSSPSREVRSGSRNGSTTRNGAPVRRDDRPGAEPRVAPRSDDGWRSPSTPARTDRDAGDRPVQRNDGSRSGTSSTPDRREAPAPRTDAPSPRSSGSSDSWRNDSSPRPAAPSPRTEAPAPRRSEGWRTQDVPRRESRSSRYEAPAPRSYEAPRRESRSSRYEAPAPRSYEAPRRESRSSRYEAPAPRSYEAPRRESRSSRYEAPAPRSYSAPRSSSPSTSRGSSAPSRSSSPSSSSSPSRSAPSSSSGSGVRRAGPR